MRPRVVPASRVEPLGVQHIRLLLVVFREAVPAQSPMVCRVLLVIQASQLGRHVRVVLLRQHVPQGHLEVVLAQHPLVPLPVYYEERGAMHAEVPRRLRHTRHLGCVAPGAEAVYERTEVQTREEGDSLEEGGGEGGVRGVVRVVLRHVHLEEQLPHLPVLVLLLGAQGRVRRPQAVVVQEGDRVALHAQLPRLNVVRQDGRHRDFVRLLAVRAEEVRELDHVVGRVLFPEGPPLAVQYPFHKVKPRNGPGVHRLSGEVLSRRLELRVLEVGHPLHEEDVEWHSTRAEHRPAEEEVRHHPRPQVGRPPPLLVAPSAPREGSEGG
mmetsp:Transcript_71667/g.226415  ORF Transcript_71667/g.226415 Transcript_71667/m.226415 type:complete len:324 (-) Transcript_71667:248-1219(-)